jgi:predicted acyl esterase
MFEQNATIVLKNDCGHVRVNVYRPKTTERVPVLVTYGPYGKDIPYSEYVPTSEGNPPSQA